MGDSTILITTSYLEEMAQGNGPSEFERLILRGLELIHVGKGTLRCKLVVTDRVAEEDGTWHPGAIMAVYSFGDGLYTSVDLNCSFYSTVKIQEKVEIEGKVKGARGGLKSAEIEMRRETSGEIIATGRLWMAPLSRKFKHNNPSSSLSKL